MEKEHAEGGEMPAQFDEHGGLMNAAAASGGTIGPDDTDGVVPLHHHAAVGDDEEGGVGKSMVVGAGRPVIAVPPPSSTRNVATTTKSHGSSSKTAAVSAATKYKKAPDAPKRFKSAFIIYSAEKHKEIKEDLAKQGRAEKTTDIAKLVSEAWREMDPTEKESWETKARKDKARYEVEKSMYKGPWKVLANKRTPKDPSAPKRPMSAFLAFSNKRRAGLKREHPEATNADLSKMLSKTWREAPDELRKKYTDEEAELRSHYKVEMAKWRKKVADERKQERTEREDLAMLAAEARANEPPSSSKVAPSRMGAAGLGGGGGAGQFGGGGMGHVSANPNLSNLRGQMQSEMNSGLPGSAGQMYGNPYGMSNVGGLGSFGLPGGGGSADPSHYANLMAGGNPFGGSQFSMGANNSSQHQLLLNQLLGQQFKNSQSMGSGNPLGMYSGLGGGQGNQSQVYGGGNPGGGYGFGMGNGMDGVAAQRALMEAQGQMQHQMQNPQQGQNSGGGGANGNFHVGGGFGGPMGGGNNMGGMGGGGGGNMDWLGQNFSRSSDKKEEEDQQQNQQQYRGGSM